MINSSPQETILSRASIEWSLSKLDQVAETETSWVFKAQRENGKPAALKVYKSGTDQAERPASALLEWYGGEGAVGVYGHNEDALLMEWVEGHTLAEPAREGKDDEAAIAIATLAGQMHKPRSNPPQDLVPLRKHVQDLFSADVRKWPDTARDLYARCVGIAYGVFDRPAADLPLHGALYHENIVLSDRGWLARDAVGLLGDPAHELAPAFLSPWGEVKLGANPVRINALADTFSERLGYSRKRILAFAAIHAAHSACRAVAEGRGINWQLAVLPNLLAVYDAA